ncbi:MAG: hypothetical protein HQ521_11495 [Bacteroidetes bacterium]|nr:hypothetical protein [Bacteroidota bacterium]
MCFENIEEIYGLLSQRTLISEYYSERPVIILQNGFYHKGAQSISRRSTKGDINIVLQITIRPHIFDEYDFLPR